MGTPRADEVAVVSPVHAGFVALYRRADRVVGALTIDRPRDIMKFRRQIAERAGWGEAVAFASALSAVPA